MKIIRRALLTAVLIVAPLSLAVAQAPPAHANSILACANNPVAPYFPLYEAGPVLTQYGVGGYVSCEYQGPPFVWDIYQTCIWHSANGVDNWVDGNCDTNDGLGYEMVYSPVVPGCWWYALVSFYYPPTQQTNILFSGGAYYHCY